MLRQTAKKFAPGFVKEAARKLRSALNGPGIEHSALKAYVFAADQTARPRLNLIIPSASAKAAFGGITTGLRFFEDLVEAIGPDADVRVITEEAIDPNDTILSKFSRLARADALALPSSGHVIPTRPRDFFVVYNWWISLNIEAVLGAQAAHFAQDKLPKIHIIQEYEPNFYPFSAAHLLARTAMGESWPLWAVFNTHELYNYWHAQGHKAEQSFVFEPRMNGAIRPFIDGLQPSDKRRTLFVYGRPQIPRNAFFLVRRGLEIWAAKYGTGHRDWRILSAGMPHPDIPLGSGHQITSLGKLSLEDYGQLLRETAVGLSLMSSPHPSYPPLEMAHFGVRVVTNSYLCKTPGERHENLVAPENVTPEAIAEAVEACIREFETDPSTGLRAESRMPYFLEDEQIECVPELAEKIKFIL